MSTSVMAQPGDNAKEKRSKWRLSNPFNKDKDGNHEQAHLAPNNTRDSAYGGSETTSDISPALSSQAIPTISQGQAESQGAPVETKTDSRGRVVTTTTTTVTTTTTTTEGDAVQVPPGEEVMVRREEHAHPAPQESDGHPAWTQSGPKTPPIPSKNNTRNKSPHGGHLAAQKQYPAEMATPASPTHQNFSYPGRQSVASPTGRRSSWDQQQPAYQLPHNENRPRPPADPSYGQPPLNENSPTVQYNRQSVPPSLQPGDGMASSGGPQQGYQPRQSTAQSIRTAAAGIHGAGETIRGALNSSIARRTGGTQEEIAQHEAITERGRREIETGHFVKRPTPVPEVPETPPPVPEEANQGKKKLGGLKNVLRKKSPARNVW